MPNNEGISTDDSQY